MSDTLYRYYARAEGKHIYRKSVCDTSCEFYECFNRATGEFGVYCDSTFYPRCWNPSIENWQVTVPCCDTNSIPGTCCGEGYTEMPEYIYATVSGLTSGSNFELCSAVGGCYQAYPYSYLNGSYVLKHYPSIGQRCLWTYSQVVTTCKHPSFDIWCVGYITVYWLKGVYWLFCAGNGSKVFYTEQAMDDWIDENIGMGKPGGESSCVFEYHSDEDENWNSDWCANFPITLSTDSGSVVLSDEP